MGNQVKSVEDMVALLSPISLFSRLGQLRFSAMSFASKDPELVNADLALKHFHSIGPVRIEELDVLSFRTPWISLLYPFVLENHTLEQTLHTVTAYVSGPWSYTRQLGRFLADVGPALRCFKLNPAYSAFYGREDDFDPWQTLNLHRCENLQTLVLTLDIRDLVLTPAWYAHGQGIATHAFEQLLVPERLPALRRFTLRVWVEDGNRILDALDWSAVEAALRRLPTLKTFVVDLAWWQRAPTEDLAKKMPELHRTNVFQLCVAPGPEARWWSGLN
ncbi:uncharacterized protein BXZ73DRAFT_101895 [Epithele typhae]|uniref:uncharacterized protein n=1 Tax=Epithele typhae TaxID=378194 RepID=UPI002008832E|nr:uncharacterized protein BXZ73DRAFT_101895 [Epithele typhae]KAH9930525.1 hypothetical protein BXZ73DRAFT_101895 [Epithele typhae]